MFEVRDRRPFPQELGIQYDRKFRIRIFVLDDPVPTGTVDLVTTTVAVSILAFVRSPPAETASQTVLVRLLANRASVHVDFETDG